MLNFFNNFYTCSKLQLLLSSCATQQTFPCSNSTRETPEKSVEYVQS